jgi:hypothetical protein
VRLWVGPAFVKSVGFYISKLSTARMNRNEPKRNMRDSLINSVHHLEIKAGWIVRARVCLSWSVGPRHILVGPRGDRWIHGRGMPAWPRVASSGLASVATSARNALGNVCCACNNCLFDLVKIEKREPSIWGNWSQLRNCNVFLLRWWNSAFQSRVYQIHSWRTM